MFRAAPGLARSIAGPTFWPIEQTAEVLRGYREFLPAQPRELNGFFAYDDGAARADVPAEELHGRKVCGDRLVPPRRRGRRPRAARAGARQVGTPLLHGPRPLPFPALQSAVRRRSTRRGTSGTGGRTSCATLPDAAVEQHAEFGEPLPTGQSTMHLYPIDGAVHDVGAADTPFATATPRGPRSSSASTPTRRTRGDAPRLDRRTTGRRRTRYSAGGAYVNFMMDEGDERVRATYRRQLRPRLARVKRDVRPGEPVPREPEHHAGAGGLIARPERAWRRSGAARAAPRTPPAGPRAPSTIAYPPTAPDGGFVSVRPPKISGVQAQTPSAEPTISR